jgi:hypothetical protein
MFIPKKIRVGYKNISDTYNGKLAYIIYYDKNNKIRKEASWNGWRDKKIEPNEYDNEPTEGFVLNKKAGDYKSSWGGRKAYSRIYDPRGFEFEINIDNLLYILEHCKSDPGKALGGKFVYAWDGKELVLLPEGTPEFKESQAFSELKETKINFKKIEVGKEYYSKQEDAWCLYMGEFYTIMEPGYRSTDSVRLINESKKIFRVNGEFKTYWRNETTFVAKRDCSESFEDIMTDLLENSVYTDAPESLKLKKAEYWLEYAKHEGKILRQSYRYELDGTKDYYGRYVQKRVPFIQSASLVNNKIEWTDIDVSLETFNTLPKLGLFIKTKKGKEYQHHG